MGNENGNGNKTNITMIIALLAAVGGSVGYSSGGDELLSQQFGFMKDDIKGIENRLEKESDNRVKALDDMDAKLQIEQRLLDDIVTEKNNALDRLLQTEIEAVHHELETQNEHMQWMEERIRELEMSNAALNEARK